MKYPNFYIKDFVFPVEDTIKEWSIKEREERIKCFPRVQKRKHRMLKRGLDVVISLLMLILVLSWLIPILSILIFFDVGMPVFFVQKRIGQYNQPFCCLKLRTMHKAKTSSRKRISRLGQFLRNNKLDELPQFINVLKGEMSIVGPRPHMLRDHQVFSQAIGKKYHHRHVCLPGITGLAQISGYEGRIKSAQMLDGRIRLDLFYLREWSIKLELLILWKTLLFIFRGFSKQKYQVKPGNRLR